jgi:hypothetical protein
MLGLISVSSFLALGAFMSAGIRVPSLATPMLGLGLLSLSAITVISGVASLL